jgi:hypothetical protein
MQNVNLDEMRNPEHDVALRQRLNEKECIMMDSETQDVQRDKGS